MRCEMCVVKDFEGFSPKVLTGTDNKKKKQKKYICENNKTYYTFLALCGM